MGEDNVIEFGAALEGPERLGPLLEELAPKLLDANAAELVEALRSLLSPPDVAVVNDGLAAELIAATGEGIRASRAGWLDDDLAFAKPWGFELGSISVPVQLWQGRQDLMVPPAHGEWLRSTSPASTRGSATTTDTSASSSAASATRTPGCSSATTPLDAQQRAHALGLAPPSEQKIR